MTRKEASSNPNTPAPEQGGHGDPPLPAMTLVPIVHRPSSIVHRPSSIVHRLHALRITHYASSLVHHPSPCPGTPPPRPPNPPRGPRKNGLCLRARPASWARAEWPDI